MPSIRTLLVRTRGRAIDEQNYRLARKAMSSVTPRELKPVAEVSLDLDEPFYK